jgi:hypothetical protein
MVHSRGRLLRGEDGRLLDLNSPHSLFGHTARLQRNLACHCCEAGADNGHQLHMRLYTVMHEAAANSARRTSLAEDCCVADFPPPMVLRVLTRPASIQAESAARA